MAKLTILEFPDPRLRKKAVPVDAVDDALRALISSVNYCSREWVYEQYDTMVMADSARTPGAGGGLAEQVETIEQRRNRLGLDRWRDDVSEFREHCAVETGIRPPVVAGAIPQDLGLLVHRSQPLFDLQVIGDIISTGMVESPANCVDDIIAEIAAARVTERGSRADDKASEAAMEDRKKAGYF